MTEGIRAPNLPLGTDISEFIGLETVGTAKSIKRFPRASVLGVVDAVVSSFQAGGGIIFTTKAQANATLVYDAFKMAWVVLDPVAENNGVYQKTGASGTGSWARLANLPYSFYRALNDGAGTANAIVATNGYPMASTESLIVVNVSHENTSSTVTLTLNGAAPLTIKTASGNLPAVGGLLPDMLIAGYIDGNDFRLISDQASSAIQAASEAAAAIAVAARDIATGAMTALEPHEFTSKEVAEAYDPAMAPDYIRLAFLDSAKLDGSGGLFDKETGSIPTNWPSFNILEGSSFQYRNRKVWRPEHFSGLDDAAFAKMMTVLGEGDTVDLGGNHYTLANDIVFPAIERLQILGNPKFTFTLRADNESGKFKFESCRGVLVQGRFEVTGAENATTWAALADEAARTEIRPLFFFKDCQDASMSGIFQTDSTSTVVTARTSLNFFVEGIRHSGWLDDLAPVTDNTIPSDNGVPDPQYLMTVRLLGSEAATAKNIRVDHHGSAVVNGSDARKVRAEDVVAKHMYDNGVYNSSGDDFLATGITVDYCRGTAAKSRGNKSTIAHVKAFSCVVGAAVTAVPNTDGDTSNIIDVVASVGHIAAYVDDVTDGGPITYMSNVTVRGATASDMRGTGTNSPFQGVVAGNARVLFDDTHCIGFDADIGLLMTGVNSGEGNGAKNCGVTNSTFDGGVAGIELDYMQDYRLEGNSFKSLSATNVVIILEGFGGKIKGNSSADPTKRINLSSSGAGCKYNRALSNDMSVTGPTTLNEYWGNANIQQVAITGNIPFRGGQMGFSSGAGAPAMVSIGTSATTDWKTITA